MPKFSLKTFSTSIAGLGNQVFGLRIERKRGRRRLATAGQAQRRECDKRCNQWNFHDESPLDHCLKNCLAEYDSFSSVGLSALISTSSFLLR